MAKRKRLAPPLGGFADTAGDRPAPDAGRMMPPVASQVGDSATTAALREVSDALRSAREEGRLLQRIPLDQVDTSYLVRDRIALNEEDMATLVESLRARGQQTPIDVVPLKEGLFGLISGLRRLSALKRLHAETGDPAFGSVLAHMRQPDQAGDAYLAMVEENEIRAGLSYYERARVVAKAAEAGAFDSDQAALKALFASASRPRRSKIGSFLGIYHALDGALRFPEAIAERQGLALAKALGRPDFAPALRRQLADAAPDSPEVEQALLTRALSGPRARPAATPTVTPPAPPAATPVTLSDGPDGTLTLSGPGITPAFRARLADWLRAAG